MNDIIRNIEEAQLRADAPQFNVGDTVKVYGKIKEGNREKTGRKRKGDFYSPQEFQRSWC